MEKIREWDIYEAAILLEAYLKVRDGILSRQEAIKDVSRALRIIAINQGAIIDEVYRDENGISYQFQRMDSAFSRKEVILPSTKLFDEIVELYTNKRNKYDAILSEAHDLIESQKTVAELFKDWLSCNYPKLKWDAVTRDLQTAEEFCTKKLLLKAPLLETTDTASVKRVFTAVESDKLFRFTYKSRKNDIHKAVSLYYKFVKSLAVNAQISTLGRPTEETDPTISSEKSSTESIGTVLGKEAVSASIEQVGEETARDSVLEYLKSNNVEYLDLRAKQGCLWIIGGMSIDRILNPLRAAGMVFVYQREGGTATGGREAYWTKDSSAGFSFERAESPRTSIELPKQSTATDQNLQRKYPNEYELIRKSLYELTREKNNGITLFDFQDALKYKVSYLVSNDILTNAPWSEKCGTNHYGMPIFKYIGEQPDDYEDIETPAELPDYIKESFNQTVEYLKTRYKVRLAYDHIENPAKRSYEMLYMARNDYEDVMWIYYIYTKTSHYVSVETEPEYLESIEHGLSGFTSIIDGRSHPCRKLIFEDYTAIKDSLVEICDSIDCFFSDRQQHFSNPYRDSQRRLDVGTKALDWSNPSRLEYTKPVAFEYFGESTSVNSWVELFVGLLDKLRLDYPNVIKPNMCLAEKDNCHIELGDLQSSLTMRKARALSDSGLFVEVNFSAKDIVNRIRHLLDLCLIDYANVEIHYAEGKNKIEEQETQIKPFEKVGNSEDQRLSSQYPEYIEAVESQLYELTSNGKKGVTASYMQKAFKGVIPYSAVDDILSHASWSVIAGSMAYGVKVYKHSESTEKTVTGPASLPHLIIPKPSTAKDMALSGKVESAVMTADLDGITVEDLAVKMEMPVSTAKKCAQESMNIVSVCDRLIHKEAFMDWDDGADKLEAVLDKLMARNNGYVSDSQLYDFARIEMQMFLNDNDMDDKRKVFDLAEHLFSKEGYHGKHYTFWMKTHISPVQDTITSKLDVMRKYARDEGGFFREYDLENYLNSLGIKTSNLRQQMKVNDEPIFLFYESGVFITAESMGINDAWLDRTAQAFAKLFADVGDHIVLRDIQPWWYNLLIDLPGNRPWTPLLLQSVLMHYGNRVGARTISALAGQHCDTLNSMLVSLQSEIQTFADAVIAILIEEHIEQRQFEAEELRHLLVSHGLIAGNELIWNMPKALPNDGRYAWDAEGQNVTINI